jgi:hypothetical protein
MRLLIIEDEKRTATHRRRTVNSDTAMQKSFIIAFPNPGAAYSSLKVDTTPALQHLPLKVKKNEYCDE